MNSGFGSRRILAVIVCCALSLVALSACNQEPDLTAISTIGSTGASVQSAYDSLAWDYANSCLRKEALREFLATLKHGTPYKSSPPPYCAATMNDQPGGPADALMQTCLRTRAFEPLASPSPTASDDPCAPAQERIRGCIKDGSSPDCSADVLARVWITENDELIAYFDALSTLSSALSAVSPGPSPSPLPTGPPSSASSAWNLPMNVLDSLDSLSSMVLHHRLDRNLTDAVSASSAFMADLLPHLEEWDYRYRRNVQDERDELSDTYNRLLSLQSAAKVPVVGTRLNTCLAALEGVAALDADSTRSDAIASAASYLRKRYARPQHAQHDLAPALQQCSAIQRSLRSDSKTTAAERLVLDAVTQGGDGANVVDIMTDYHAATEDLYGRQMAADGYALCIESSRIANSDLLARLKSRDFDLIPIVSQRFKVSFGAAKANLTAAFK